MAKLIDLSHARILVSNDDGIEAEGIRVLEAIARTISNDVWVVAPATEQSGVSHSLSLHLPVRVLPMGEKRFAVTGSPTDAVLMAVSHLMKDSRPTLCLSGVNRGGNLAEDVTYSGTVAAAMEATLLGVPAIAFSQTYRDPADIKWRVAERYAPDIIRKLAKVAWPADVLYNVNFPDVEPDQVAAVIPTVQGRRDIVGRLHERVDPRGRPYFWIGPLGHHTKEYPETGTDIVAMREHKISVTPIGMDMTHYKTLNVLRDGEFK